MNLLLNILKANEELDHLNMSVSSNVGVMLNGGDNGTDIPSLAKSHNSYQVKSRMIQIFDGYALYVLLMTSCSVISAQSQKPKVSRIRSVNFSPD